MDQPPKSGERVGLNDEMLSNNYVAMLTWEGYTKPPQMSIREYTASLRSLPTRSDVQTHFILHPPEHFG